MKKIFILLLVTVTIGSCSKKSDDPGTSTFTNKIILGTGLNTSNPFELVGVGTTFVAASVIYFRLESADDMAGSKVRLQINYQDGTPYKTIPDYDNPQSSGHIFISGFSVPDKGSFKATGILVTGLKTVASVNFVLN